jgi:hypothetical protein
MGHQIPSHEVLDDLAKFLKFEREAQQSLNKLESIELEFRERDYDDREAFYNDAKQQIVSCSLNATNLRTQVQRTRWTLPNLAQDGRIDLTVSRIDTLKSTISDLRRNACAFERSLDSWYAWWRENQPQDDVETWNGR